MVVFSFSVLMIVTHHHPPRPGERIKNIRNNSPYLIYGLIFLSNIMASQLMSTGAFEIYHGQELLFSKIRTGTDENCGGRFFHIIVDTFRKHRII
jgi:hypothetical protein